MHVIKEQQTPTVFIQNKMALTQDFNNNERKVFNTLKISGQDDGEGYGA